MFCMIIQNQKTVASVASEFENIYVNPCVWLYLGKVLNSLSLFLSHNTCAILHYYYYYLAVFPRSEQTTEEHQQSNSTLYSVMFCGNIFLGLRGAVAFALVLHLQLDDEKRHVLITSTLIIIMFTILCLGGSTLPLLKVFRV